MFLTLLLIALTIGVLILFWAPVASMHLWKIIITVTFVVLWILYFVPIGAIHK